jgi:hypothetical protein
MSRPLLFSCPGPRTATSRHFSFQLPAAAGLTVSSAGCQAAATPALRAGGGRLFLFCGPTRSLAEKYGIRPLPTGQIKTGKIE